MATNGITASVGSSGVIVSGYLYGSNFAPITTTLLSEDLLLYAKTIQLPYNVTSNANNTFSLPVAFGDNKMFLFSNGKLFELGIDYIVQGTSVRWLSGSSLATADKIIAFGPANVYTSKAITYQKINNNTQLNTSDVDFSNQTTIELLIPINEPNTSIPFDTNSIYVFKNGDLYSPNEHFDFDEASQKIVWTDLGSVPSLIDSLFVFYYNQHSTTPFMLGERLNRDILTATVNSQSTFNLLANTNDKLKTTAQLFLNSKRYIYNKDFSIYFPTLYTISTGELQGDIVNGSKIDISYFKTDNLIDQISMIHRYFYQSGDFVPTITPNLTRMALTPVGDVINSKTMLFFRGVLGINKWFDNTVPDIETAAGVPNEWYRDTSTNQLYWNGQARNSPSNPLNPNDTQGDFLTWSAFTDPASLQYLKIEYHQRSSVNIPGSITTTSDIKNNKCIVFYNGQALFREYNQFTITGNNTLTINEYSAPPLGFTDEVIVWYCSDSSYANFWKIDALTPSSQIVELNPILFPTRISSLDTSMLFYNGVRIDNRFYEFVPATDNRQIRFTAGSGIVILSGTKLTMVHT